MRKVLPTSAPGSRRTATAASIEVPEIGSTPTRPTSSSRRCARPCSCWDRFSRAPARCASRSRADAPSGCARSTSTSRRSASSERRCASTTATSRPGRRGSTARTIVFETVTVTGTENAMLAATLASRHHASRQRGARARSHRPRPAARRRWARGSTAPAPRRSLVEGVEGSTASTTTSSRTGSRPARTPSRPPPRADDVTVRGCAPEHLMALTSRLTATGARIDAESETPCASGPRARSQSHDVATAPYPGFPTDLQAQWMALADRHGRRRPRSPRRSSRTAFNTWRSSSGWARASAWRAGGRSSRAPPA